MRVHPLLKRYCCYISFRNRIQTRSWMRVAHCDLLFGDVTWSSLKRNACWDDALCSSGPKSGGLSWLQRCRPLSQLNCRHTIHYSHRLSATWSGVWILKSLDVGLRWGWWSYNGCSLTLELIVLTVIFYVMKMSGSHQAVCFVVDFQCF